MANTGYIPLTGLAITDSLLLGASARTLTSGPTLSSGDTNSNGQIDTTETWNYAATYAVPQSDIDRTGNFANIATFDTAQTLPATSNTAATTVTCTPLLAIAKSWAFNSPGGDVIGNGKVDRNDTLRYSYAVTNTGNVTTASVAVTDVHLGLGTPPEPLGETITTDAAPVLDSTDATANNGIWTSLRPGDTVTFRGNYLVTQADIDHQ